MKGLETTVGFGGNQEQVRHRVYLGVTLFSWIGQLLALLFNLSPLAGKSLGLRWDLVYGLGLCSLILLLMFTRWLTQRQIEYLVIVSASLAVVAQLVLAVRQPQAFSPHLYFIIILMVLASFSILPIRQALAYVVVLYAGFVVLALSHAGGSDPVLLTFVGVATVLTIQLSLFGRQISTERVESQLYQKLALTDPLTGLENRRSMYPRLDQAHLGTSLSRVTTVPAALLLLDIDHFKRINDRHGHQFGDQVLVAVAGVLRSAALGEEAIARWGGEEFLVLLTGEAASRAPALADQLLHAIRRAEVPGGVSVTVSGGLAYSHEAATVPAWLHLADVRQYEAKRLGRDQIQELAV